ncbi:gliding motility-associated C-terminal domain-containing protein [Labilibacter sediminis]|nr:gliding motility-associated C-terminal domain-containing protein [Labilibacter sediminis]
MKILTPYIFLLLVALSTQALNAQIISPERTTSIPTQYPEHSEIDSIYFYTDISSGTLSAMPIAGTNVKYTWYEFNNSNWEEKYSGNDPEFPSDIEHQKAYRVSITDNDIPAGTYTCWTFQPKIESAEIDTIVNNCTSLQLSVETTQKELFYYDLTSLVQIPLAYQYTYEWSSVPIGDIEGNTEAKPIIAAPVDTTTYSVEVTAFKASNAEDDIKIDNPKAVKADFTFDVIDRGHENEYPKNNEYKDITTYNGSSPVVVSINNKSKGSIQIYQWEIYKNDEFEKPDEGANPAAFTFDEVGEYRIQLEVENTTSKCTDTQSSGTITTIEMEVEVPNAFTPNGDGINDKFMVAYESVRDFKMVILNRWGRKVFQTTDPGDSWDGKIGSRKAAEGVYFYYIDAKGFNEGEQIKLEGPLHLIRGK